MTSPGQPAAFTPDALAHPSQSRHILLRGGAVISMDESIGDLAVGDVLISGDRVAAVGPDLGDTAPADAIVVDMSGKIVLPGMVDGHRHSWQCLFRRMTPDVDSTDAYGALYLQSLAPAYQPEDIYAANLLTATGRWSISVWVSSVIRTEASSRRSPGNESSSPATSGCRSHPTARPAASPQPPSSD